MSNVRCSSVGKIKGAVQIQIWMANALWLSANMAFIAAGHQSWKCKMVMMIQRKCKMQNGDDDAKIWSSFVAFLISSLLILPFQVECTYVLSSSICVNVFSFHVACNHCSPICFLDHICDTVIVVKHQTPGPVELQYGEAPPHHRDLCPSSSWDIQTSQSQ